MQKIEHGARGHCRPGAARRAALAGTLVALLLSFVPFAAAGAGDWPIYGGDPQRSHVTEAGLEAPLELRWIHRAGRPPAPAWPEPVKNFNRLDFDYAFEPVVAGDLVLYGSSSEDCVRALDRATGAVRWRFTAGGPVRFAPQVVGDRVFFGADDGRVYCLDAADGRLVWRFDAGPYDQRQVGNGRMISRWPIRTGVVVDEGTVYFAAGVWPAEGVFVWALDAADGTVRWCNDTSHAITLEGIHKATTLNGVAPQGPILATDDLVLVPTGRSVPAAYDRATGELRHYLPIQAHNGAGGSWVGLAGDHYYTFRKSFYSPLSAGKFDLATGRLLGSTGRTAVQNGTFHRDRGYSTYEGQVTAIVDGGGVRARLAYGLARAGDALVVGLEDRLRIEDPESEALRWEHPVQGRVYGLAPTGRELVASTDRGVIYCFGPAGEPVGDAPAPSHPAARPADLDAPAPAAGPAAPVVRALEQVPAGDGWLLVPGRDQAELARAMAAVHRWRVILAVRGAAAARSLREELGAGADYGRWLVVHEVEAFDRLPFASMFASGIVAPADVEPAAARELYRVLRPYGGVLLVGPDVDEARAQALAGAAGAGEGELTRLGERWGLRRGPLPGALDWDSPFRADKRVRWPLRLLWYGGPGPARMHSRKHRATTVAFAHGRYFVKGQTHVIAVDAYTGRELWSQPTSGVAVLAADRERVYATVSGKRFGGEKPGPGTLVLDARTGKPEHVFGPDPATWPDWLAALDVPRAGALEALEKRHRKWRPFNLTDGEARGARRHPLTGVLMPRSWTKAFGCSGMTTSATAAMTRSGTLAVYDFADDSGVRAFAGLRPSCGQSTISALGLWIVNEGSASCECTYNYQASLALAPAHRRLNEDWAFFGEWRADTLVRRAALNLGAPGDRRDADGRLWLGMPRPVADGGVLPKRPGSKSWQNIPGLWQQEVPFTMEVPAQIEAGPDGDRWRVSSDRVVVAGTDRPWLYGSGWRDLRRITFRLDPRPRLATAPAGGAVEADGRLEEPAWDRDPDHVLEGANAELRFAHDDDAIHVAVHRAPRFDRKGAFQGWNGQGAKHDHPVWRGDSFELFLTDGDRAAVVHLAVSASGTRYDALQPAGGSRNARWNPDGWRAGVVADESGFTAEISVTRALLEEAGLDPAALEVNVQANRRHNVGEAIVLLGVAGRERPESFVPLGLGAPAPTRPRTFTVALHFAEIDETVAPGDRVFDVAVQGAPALEGLDIVREAGGPRRAVVRRIEGVDADETLTVELAPRSAGGRSPMLSAIEIHEEGWSEGEVR